MARKPGRLTKVRYTTDIVTAHPMTPTPAYVDLLNIVDASLNLEQSELEVTSHDDGAWQAYLAGRKGGTMDISMRYDDADTSQDAMRTSFFAGITLRWQFRLDTGTGIEQYTFLGFITSIKPSGPNNDPAAYDISVRIAGSVTMDDQT